MDVEQDLRVLFCECANAAVLPATSKDAVRRALTAAGLAFDVVQDLCGLAARKDPLLAELACGPGLAVAACHPRAVKWLFAAGGAPLREAGVSYLDMRATSAGDLGRSVEELSRGMDGSARPDRGTDAPASGAVAEPAAAGAGLPAAAQPWRPWFPVIDRDRCENCQQCLGFCLFGVYGIGADGAVEARNPANCKYGCPACARVCPSAAIVFPKYANAPINGGEAKPGDPLREPVQIDKAALLSGDTLKILQDRGKHAMLFARESNEFRALQERMKHLSGSGRPLTLVPVEPPAAPRSEESS